jgi:catechol 2,3-dioxygenase-like lactoylglutathione lyase family enzyme
MTTRIGRILLYVRDIEKTVAFYTTHFGFHATQDEGDRIVELVCPNGGANLMIHPAANGQKQGRSTVKIIFDVEDVESFIKISAATGLNFGTPHKADGYVFANAKDLDGNSISVSSRVFRKRG